MPTDLKGVVATPAEISSRVSDDLKQRWPLTSFSLLWERCSFSNLDHTCGFSLRSKMLIWLWLKKSSLKFRDAQCAGPGRCSMLLWLMSKDRKLWTTWCSIESKVGIFIGHRGTSPGILPDWELDVIFKATPLTYKRELELVCSYST